ncbi:MAG: DUF2703 domain-containing protein, partial [Terracidiphilus sp.]
MTLEFLYLAGCPNHEATVELVQRVLGAEGMAVEVRQTLICNHEEANAHGFPGSPTVRVNGRDIEKLAAARLGVGFACRTYFVDGRAQGVP